jgi:hypothetical protein
LTLEKYYQNAYKIEVFGESYLTFNLRLPEVSQQARGGAPPYNHCPGWTRPWVSSLVL